MRINKFLARSTGFSRRKIDSLISEGRVFINDGLANLGSDVNEFDIIKIDGKIIDTKSQIETLILNKPEGYIVSRNAQGGRSVYELLDHKFHKLKPVGRLDKDSSGLLLFTTDGDLANQLLHPSAKKTKIYKVQLDKGLLPLHQQMISDIGISLEDGISKLHIQSGNDKRNLVITMSEGRNRQIRRTFRALGYNVVKLHRITFGNFELGDLKSGQIRLIK